MAFRSLSFFCKSPLLHIVSKNLSWSLRNNNMAFPRPPSGSRLFFYRSDRRVTQTRYVWEIKETRGHCWEIRENYSLYTYTRIHTNMYTYSRTILLPLHTPFSVSVCLSVCLSVYSVSVVSHNSPFPLVVLDLDDGGGAFHPTCSTLCCWASGAGAERGSLFPWRSRHRSLLHRWVHRLSLPSLPQIFHNKQKGRRYKPSYTARFLVVSHLMIDHIETISTIPKISLKRKSNTVA